MKLQLYFPVKPNVINQPFGTNGAYYQSHGINIVGHNGIDFQSVHGQSVYATHDGICYPEVDNQGGNGVVIRTSQTFDDGNGGQCFYKTIYWHLTQDDAVVKEGQVVKAGDLIGYADNTGLSTGDHLHFGLKPQLPGEPEGTWYNTQQTNGYLGAIDPSPFFNGIFAQDIPEIQSVVVATGNVVNSIASSNEPDSVKVGWLGQIGSVLKKLLDLLL